jgi:hypothetical protein
MKIGEFIAVSGRMGQQHDSTITRHIFASTCCMALAFWQGSQIIYCTEIGSESFLVSHGKMKWVGHRLVYKYDSIDCNKCILRP